MKTRIDKILLAVFVLSLAFYAADIIFGKGYYPWEIRLALSFHAIPAFCLQLLLCRRTQGRFAAAPVLTLLGVALFFTLGWLTTTGWDSLGWLLLLCLCIAPAVGFALAWAVSGCWKLYRKGGVRNAD